MKLKTKFWVEITIFFVKKTNVFLIKNIDTQNDGGIINCQSFLSI